MDHSDSLSELYASLKVMRDRIRGVAQGYHAGFYLFGRPGTSKTYTVKKTLDELGVKYEYFNGHLTAIGLLDLLEEFPDSIIILDDVSEIFGDRKALQMFLAALGNQPELD